MRKLILLLVLSTFLAGCYTKTTRGWDDKGNFHQSQETELS